MRYEEWHDLLLSLVYIFEAVIAVEMVWIIVLVLTNQ